MPNVFDLSKISRIVESNHPVCILVIDTNVLMDEPDLANWNVTMGPTLFVLSDGTIQELEYIRHKAESPEKRDSREKAAKARISLANLFGKGKVTDGIPIKAGWVIGVPSPKQDQLDMELKQIEDIVKAFGRSDAKLLILTKECDQSFESTPVILETGEVNLYNASQMNGIPCHLCTGFPIERLKEVDEKIGDWNQAFKEMQVTTKQNSIAVEATLTAYKSAPQWLGTKSLIIAEGYGTVYDGNKNRSFLWTIPFYPQNIISIPKSSEKKPDLPSVHLDFLGENDFDQNLFDGIADRLSDCTNPSFEEGKPTLQNPESVMEMLLYFEYINRKGAPEEALERLRQEIEDSEGLIHYWTDWILDLEDDEDEQTACLEGFIEAVKSCWKIGQTYKFSFIPPK